MNNLLLPIIVGIVCGYLAYILARRKDYLSLKRSIYIEAISNLEVNLETNTELSSKIDFIAGEKLRNLIKFRRFIQIYRKFFDSKVGQIKPSEKSSDKFILIKKVLDRTIQLYEEIMIEIKKEMKNESRMEGIISNYNYIKQEFDEIKELIEEANLLKEDEKCNRVIF